MFEKSESIKEIAAAIGGFQADMGAVAKTKDVAVATKSGGTFHYQYAPLEAIVEAIKKPMAKHGLSFSQLPDGNNGLSTILMHKSGEWLATTAIMASADATPQGQGSAITYMRRYALSALLGLATEDDDDGQGAQGAAATNSAKTASRATGAATPGQGQNNADKPACPKCKGDMWDNRPKKASGEYSAKAPDFKCKDKACDGARWPKKDEDDIADAIADGTLYPVDDEIINAMFEAENER